MRRKIGQKVYVLNGGCIGDRYVVGVFSSMKRAETVRNWIIQNDTYYNSYPDDLSIDAFEMNEKIRKTVEKDGKS